MTPQWFGDYEIIKRLRIGGMATLYLARRHGTAGFARLVALKMIHSHLAEQRTFIEMFVDEARICSQISHPNVVHVEEFGEIDGVHYLVMEYLDGCSLNELLAMHYRKERRLDPELAARVVLQVASGLHAAHEARDADDQPLNVIHRDISPSNILLSCDGNAKLIDFGIAKAHNRLSQTAAGISLKGKYSYVAPEQAIRTVLDRRCDIFSLGVVFWELLVGRPLFPEDTYLALFHRMARTDVAPPSAWNPAVPAVLDSIVMAMLQHDPAGRPQTAAELQRRITSAVPGAANRDPSELGALAREVRDQRAARETPGVDNHACFSPSPRSMRAGSSEYRVEIDVDAAQAADVSDVRASEATMPTRRRLDRRVQLGAVAALGIAAVVAVLWSAAGGGPARRGAAMAKHPVETRGSAAAPAAIEQPAVASPPLPSTYIAPALPAVARASPAVAPPSTVIAPPASASPSPPVAPPARATPELASAGPPAPVRGRVRTSGGSTRRPAGRAITGPGSDRQTASPAVATPDARTPRRGAASAFHRVPFDSTGDEPAALARPAAADKPTPMIPGFDR